MPMVFTVGQVAGQEPPGPGAPALSPLPLFYSPHMAEQHRLLMEMINNNQRPAQRRSVDLCGVDQIFFKDRKALLVHMWLFNGGLDNCFVCTAWPSTRSRKWTTSASTSASSYLRSCGFLRLDISSSHATEMLANNGRTCRSTSWCFKGMMASSCC